MTEDDSEDSDLPLGGTLEPEETDDEKCIWLGFEFTIPDKHDRHDPDEMQSQLREWVTFFLSNGGQNVDYEITNEGVDLAPRGKNWEETDIVVRYNDEFWFDMPDSRIGRRRKFSVWFPVKGMLNTSQISTIKEKMTYLIGDEVFDEYDEQLDISGAMIMGSEQSVRNHIKHSFDGSDFDDYI